MRSSTKTTLSILIPAYNEERTIGPVLEAVLGVDLSRIGVEKEIIVVDDGSLDGTGKVVRESFPQVRYIRHPVNRGKGAATRTAIAAAGGDILLVQDADLEYDPLDYPALLEPILSGKTEVVFGSRFRKKWYPKRMRPPHFLGNVFLTLLTNLLYGVWITDEATCYKVFKAEVLKSIPLEGEEFEFCPEITAKVCRLGYRIHEVPIHYSARLVSEGKKIAWTDGIQAIETLLKYRFFSHAWKKDARRPGAQSR